MLYVKCHAHNEKILTYHPLQFDLMKLFDCIFKDTNENNVKFNVWKPVIMLLVNIKTTNVFLFVVVHGNASLKYMVFYIQVQQWKGLKLILSCVQIACWFRMSNFL